jgi:hypothetical protein
MATVLEPEVIRRDVLPHGAAVRRQLALVRRQLRLHLLLEGLAWTVGVVALLAAVSYAADRWLRLEASTRIALLPLLIAAVLAVAYWKLVRPLWLDLADLDLAVILDRRSPGVGQRVANVLQLPDLLAFDPGASPSMIQAEVHRQADELGRMDLQSTFNRPRFQRLGAAIVLPAAVLIAASLLWPASASLWAKRWLLGSSERWPQRTYLSIVGLADGDRLYVPRGESLLIEVEGQPTFQRADENRADDARADAWTLPGRGEPLVLTRGEQPASEVPSDVRIRFRQGGVPKQSLFTLFTETRFRYELPPVQETMAFTLSGGDDWLGPIAVEPIDRPGIEDLRILSQSPGRTETETHTFSSKESQLLFLPRTKFELHLTSDVPLSRAELLTAAGQAPPLEQVDPRHFVARWRMSEPLTLEIKLVDQQAHLDSKPYYISLNLLQDRAPRVTVRSSGVGRRITPVASIPLALRATDDFGLTAVAVEVEQTVHKSEKPETKVHSRPVELPATGATDGGTAGSAGPLTDMETESLVALKEYVLTPGTTLRVRGTAQDNCAEASQAGQSRWLTFQVVTPEELFYEILMVQRAQREKFRQALEMEKSQVIALQTLIDAEQLAGIVRKHQVAARQAWQVANRLDATLREMTLNELGSTQARELLATGIIGPIRDLHNEQMSQLKSLLDQMTADPKRLAELTPASLESQQDIVQKMTTILNRMAQWESFVDVLNQVRQIIQLQNQVLEFTDKLRKERTKKVFDE